jgi:hypothetical protein
MPDGFGLAFDIERSSRTRSGFEPAQFDLGSGKDLFGNLRLQGFAAMLQLNIVNTLTIVGGDEGRYKGETPIINRASAIRLMLVKDYDIDPLRVDAQASKSNTLGNVGIIRDRSTSDDDIVVTNLYHIPRAALDIAAAGLRLKLFAAEAFLLLQNPSFKDAIIERLGGGALAERCGEEIQGIADKIRGTYKSRTDATPVHFAPSTQKT